MKAKSPLESQQDVYDRVKKTISDSIENKLDCVIKAPPSSGKSYSSAQVIADKGIHAAYFTARRDLYGEFKQWCEDRGLTVKILPSMPEDCDSYDSDEGNSAPSKAHKLYHRGISPQTIHRETDACHSACEYARKLPELEGEYKKDIPLSKYDVLIGHTKHSHVEPFVRDRTVFFDDISKQAFIKEHEVNESKLTAILQNDSFPCNSVDSLYEARGSERVRQRAIDALNDLEFELRTDEGSTTHSDAVKIVETILKSEDLGNGFAVYGYGDTDGSDREDYIGVKDGDGSVYLLNRPGFGGNKPRISPNTIIVLNGYPVEHENISSPVWLNWRLGVHTELVEPLSLAERQKYYSEIMGLSVIQTSENVKPYSSGEYVTKGADRKLIRIVDKNHDKDIPIISTKKALDLYDEDELPISSKMNFANVESNNQFKNEDVGVVLGSPEWRIHHQAKLIGAFMNQSIEWDGQKGTDKSFGDVGDPIMRAFRDDLVGQAILRFGRDESIDQSTVYVHTAAIPDDIPVSKKPEETVGGSYVSTENQILRYLQSEGIDEFEINDIKDEIEASRSSISKELKKSDRFELIEEGSGPIPGVWG
ncbi:hypothetical protein GCM10008995_26430 [Halobellus salinus]|uniref:Uncharacterized protein n=1 Tax=Halobellus salinus TaxID=931585 RepID=A0A830ET58_9EURY|nr:hypothetical protein [Halobellus salinus]GGJ15310.1 hypothetical protein GCM10008995_26430 [Halobellus salinus]SMP25165.1 hypothetical protein SAMN06265347_110116 [Halobellus salinus]